MRPPHSTALLRFDIASDRVLRDGANRGRKVAAAPKCWQSRPERAELLPQNAAGSSFQSIDDLGDTQRRVGFNKQVNVIRHDLDGVKRHAVFGGDRGEQRLEPRINRTRQDRARVFRAPHDVMLQRKHHCGVLCVSIPHSEAYMSGRISISIAGYRAGARSGFPLSPEGDTPQPEDMMAVLIRFAWLRRWSAA